LARIVAEARIEKGSWEAAREHVIASNALQARSRASTIRLERELRQRLQLLTESQLVLLAHSTTNDRAALAWLAAVKQNSVVMEFAAEVLREKLAGLDPVLRPSDYERFFELKAVSHPELAALAETTRTKVRRVILRMLLEAGILAQGPALGTVHRPVLSPNVHQAILSDDRRWLAGFLVSDAEIASA
jgi:hypothetical protein